MSYQIITDATADLTEELLTGLPFLEIIPMEVNIGGMTHCYGPGGTITPQKFYELLKDGKFASTTQINPDTYTRCFEKYLKNGMDVLYLCFSSGLSSTICSAEMSIIELQEQYPDRKILCVDTLAAAPGEGLLVRTALEKQSAGMGLEELVRWITEHRLKLCHWVTVDTLTYLHHGGRVSSSSAAMGTLLQIKPVLHMNESGHLEATEKPRGRKKATRLIVKKLEEGWDPLISNTIFIGHGDDLAGAQELQSMVLECYPNADIRIVQIGPVIGAHTGPGVLTVFYWGDNR